MQREPVARLRLYNSELEYIREALKKRDTASLRTGGTQLIDVGRDPVPVPTEQKGSGEKPFGRRGRLQQDL